MPLGPDSQTYVVPRWPDGLFNLVSVETGVEVGPCDGESWDVADNGAVTDWRSDGAHPIHLRVRMQTGDLLYANNGDEGDMIWRIVPVKEDGVQSNPLASAFDLNGELEAFWTFLSGGPLTERVKRLEHQLDGAQANELPEIFALNGISARALEAGFVARDRLGRINDVIHALAIVVALPTILEPEEILLRPSLAAGNDPTRPFDVETDRRIAEFKLSRWDGHDTARMRQLVKDLVHLAAEPSGRRAELYVLDGRPARFLENSGSTVGWAIDRFPTTRQLFVQQFGDLSRSIAEFRAGDAAQVHVIDLRSRLGQSLAEAHRQPLDS